MEEWRDIKGYEGLYQVSSKGRVKSLGRFQKGRLNSIQYRGDRILKTENRKDYLGVRFFDLKHYLVHRLVALAFPEICGDYFEGAVINHKNEIKTDNRPENLEWVTIAFNNHYGSREHLLENVVWQYTLDNVFIKEWNSLSQIERETEMKFRNIQTCCSGKSNSAYGYKWKYRPFLYETSQVLVGRMGKIKAA